MEHQEKVGIKFWSKEDQPREKLESQGKQALSNVELLAILLGSGNKNESALDLSRKILTKYNNKLNNLGKANIKELEKFYGVGKVKATTIIAALELSRRKQFESNTDVQKISSSYDAYQLIAPLIAEERKEYFKVILLNRNNKLIKIASISQGGIAATVVDAKVIYKQALDNEASSIILSHNHPSGNLNPSKEDLRLTQNLSDAGKLLDIKVLDHIIVSSKGYYSFADEGILK